MASWNNLTFVFSAVSAGTKTKYSVSQLFGWFGLGSNKIFFLSFFAYHYGESLFFRFCFELKKIVTNMLSTTTTTTSLLLFDLITIFESFFVVVLVVGCCLISIFDLHLVYLWQKPFYLVVDVRSLFCFAFFLANRSDIR